MRKKNKTKDPGAEKNAGLVTCRIITDRRPFWNGSPLPENTIVSLPREVFELLTSRKWAEETE